MGSYRDLLSDLNVWEKLPNMNNYHVCPAFDPLPHTDENCICIPEKLHIIGDRYLFLHVSIDGAYPPEDRVQSAKSQLKSEYKAETFH